MSKTKPRKTISPAHAIDLAGGTQDLLAQVFDPRVTRQAVNLWLRTGRIPQSRLWQLSQLKPEWFK